MARINNVLGISGKLGDMVICNGQKGSYVRALPASDIPPSEKQVKSRQRLSTAVKFICPFKELLNWSWKPGTRYKASPYSQAISRLIKYSFEESGSGLQIIYPNVLLSCGTGTTVSEVSCRIVGLNVFVSWISTVDQREYDKISLVFYSEQMAAAVVFKDIALRRDEAVELTLPEGFAPGSKHTWLIVSTADGKNVANSLYLGTGNSL